MKTKLLEITAPKRRDPFAVADPTDFEFSEGPTIDPQVVLTNALISLCCLDHTNRRALFVETRHGIDLSQASFLYQAQYENAVRLIGVPYNILHTLARGISVDDRKLILVYCGLPITSIDMVYQALDKDSQAGSEVSQEALSHKKSGLTETQRSDLIRELQAHPTIQTPDFVVPGTWIPTNHFQ